MPLSEKVQPKPNIAVSGLGQQYLFCFFIRFFIFILLLLASQVVSTQISLWQWKNNQLINIHLAYSLNTFNLLRKQEQDRNLVPQWKVILIFYIPGNIFWQRLPNIICAPFCTFEINKPLDFFVTFCSYKEVVFSQIIPLCVPQILSSNINAMGMWP